MHANLSDIAQIVQGNVIGDPNINITELSSIDHTHPSALIFAQDAQYFKMAEQSDAAAILVTQETTSSVKPVIQVKEPLQAFIQLLKYFHPEPKPTQSIHPTASIDPTVIIGNKVTIGAYAVIGANSQIKDHAVIESHVSIGANVTIGANTVIRAQVSIYDRTQIGSQVIIHSGAIIGSDGFGYSFQNGAHQKIPHVGNVVIENNVEIGANTVIDRATIGSTVIGEGTKIDNLVQIAHSVKLGKHNILCALTGVAGSTQSGDRVIFAANVGVSDHVRIEDDVILAARAGVPPKKHLKQGLTYLGNPARPIEKALEVELGATRIPAMRRQIKTLNEKITTLETKLQQLQANNE